MTHGVDDGGQILEGLGPGGLVGGDGTVQLLGQAQNLGGAHYSASKAAVLAFSKNLAREVSQYGITVRRYLLDKIERFYQERVLEERWDGSVKSYAQN